MGVPALTIETEPAAADVEALGRGLTEHALPFTGVAGFRPLAVFARDERGALLGGISAFVNWTWLHIALVWIAASHRGSGLGTKLLAAIEAAARERGCERAHLDTFSYQARPFYERHGYTLFAELEDYPPGHRRFYLQKALCDDLHEAPRIDLGRGIAVRPLTAEDAEALERAFAGTPWDRGIAHFERLGAEQSAGSRRVFVGLADGAPAGFASLVFAPDYPPFREAGIPEIQDLNVAPAFRRRGIASRLLEAAEQDAFAAGDALGVGVGLHPGYGVAQRLYVLRGYVPDGLGPYSRGRFPTEGERVTLDDELTLHFMKRKQDPLP